MAEWVQIKSGIANKMDKVAEAKARLPAKQSDARKVYMAARRAEEAAFREAKGLHAKFIDRLRNFRVLDPACGSGNFLYLSLLAFKDLEHRANLDAEGLGLGRFAPSVGPEGVLGIELNTYAAELARVSIWIGEIQWMRQNGYAIADRPILKPLDNIENRDALLAPEGGEAPGLRDRVAAVLANARPALQPRQVCFQINSFWRRWSGGWSHFFLEI